METIGLPDVVQTAKTLDHEFHMADEAKYSD